MYSFKIISSETWQPAADKVKKIQEELEENYIMKSKPPEKFLSNCAKITCFLMDHNAVYTQLKKLNTLLEEKISSTRGEIKVSVLRELFETELQKLGFHRGLGKTYGGALPPSTFRSMFIYGIQVKDAGFGDEQHREFPHIIQWILIGWQQQDSKFLGADQKVIDVFKQLGHSFSVFENENQSNEDSLWNRMVDVSTSTKDFRRPEYLSGYLEYAAKEFPALHSLLIKRAEKRENARKDFDAKSKNDRKLKRKPGKEPYVESKAHPLLLLPVSAEDLVKEQENLQRDFYIAVKKGDLEKIQILIEKGVDVNKPLSGITALASAISQNNVEMVKLLLRSGANLYVQSQDKTSLLNAAIKNDNIALVELLIANGAPLTDSLKLPLCEAVLIKSEKIVKTLIKHNVDVNEKQKDGSTALSLALKQNNFEMVRLLLSAGAKISRVIAGVELTALLSYPTRATDLQYTEEHRKAMKLCHELCFKTTKEGEYLLSSDNAIVLIKELIALESSNKKSALFAPSFTDFLQKYGVEQDVLDENKLKKDSRT